MEEFDRKQFAESFGRRHKMVELPACKLIAKKASGSATIIYSEILAGENGDEEAYSTYMLTNYHVVDDSVHMKEEWSTLRKKMVKVDRFDTVTAELYTYRWASRGVSGMTLYCDIMAFDKNQDLALVKATSPTRAQAVAKMYPRGKEHLLRSGMQVIACGAGLGEKPIQTPGILSQFGCKEDNLEFWLNSASVIYGNSGGALFLVPTYELIGIPSRVATTWAQAVPHMAYCIPITRIYDFLEAQKFRFIYDPNYTEAGEAELRRKIREQSELEALREDREPKIPAPKPPHQYYPAEED